MKQCWSLMLKDFKDDEKSNSGIVRFSRLVMCIPKLIIFTRSGVLEDVLGLEDTFGGPWPWPRSLKSLALASKPQVLENCPVLGSRTALFFEQLKFRWKTPETSRKICEHLFCFPHLEHTRRQGEGGRLPPKFNCNFTNNKNVTKKPIVSSVSVSF